MYINLITIDLCPGQSGGGVTPSGTLNISENGEYDVYSYSNAVVDVPAGGDQKSFTEGTVEIINNSASFVANSAFMNNKTIQTVNLPYATYVGNSAFLNCTSLSQLSLPVCSRIGIQAFANCTSLSQLSLPVCSLVNDNALRGCRSLSQLSLPVCVSIGTNVFGNCTSLSQLSLPICQYIGGNAFNGCSSLSIITIEYSNVCTLEYYTAFNKTPIASGTGSIYVPASLVDAYKSATNWSSFSSQIFPISE